MIKIFRLFIFCISFYYLAAQQVITFVKTSGEEYDTYYEMSDYVYSGLQIDGGYIAVGSSREPVPNGGDILILKIDNYGNKIWENSLIGGDDPHQDRGYDILHSNDEGYIIGGDMYFNGAQGTDAVLIKADDEGNEVWRNYYGGNGYDFAYSTTKTTDGNYASLITDCDGPDCGYFIVKINDNGNQIWSTSTFAYPGAYGTISSTDDGGIVLSYRFNNQFWIEKRDINGNIDWSQSFPGLSISDVIQTSDGGYIFAGNDDSAFPRAVLVKLDNQANQEWSFTENVYPSNMSFFRNVIETSDGGFVVTGEVNDANYSMQIYMSKFDSQGNEEWIKVHGLEGIDQAVGLIQTEDDGFFITGCSPCFDGLDDYLLMKTDENGDILGCTDSASMNYDPWASKLDISCMPNGDLNVDNQTSILDILFLVNQILGNTTFTAEQEYNTNLNGDFTIDILDIMVLVNIIMNVTTDYTGITEMDNQGNPIGNQDADDWCAPQLWSQHGLDAAYPNPFISTTSINMAIVQASNVRLSVLDNHGRVVDWISYDQNYNSGYHSMTWTPPAYLDSGMYRVKMMVENNGFGCHGDVQYDN